MINNLQEQRKDTKNGVKNLTKHQSILLSEAKKLHQNGFWIVPTIDKISQCKNDKNNRLSYLDFESIVIQKNCNGLGILTNEQNNYVSFDLDTKDATNPQLFERRLLFELGNYETLKGKIKLSKSPSGGFHLYIGTTNKKSFIGAFGWSEYSNDNKQKQTITGRATGQYCCEYPTQNYHWIIDNDLQELTSQDENDLKTIFSVLNEDKNRFERIAQEQKERFEKQLELRNNKVFTDSGSNVEIAVWDDFNNRNTVGSILIKNGFNFRYTHGDKDYYLRDGSTSKSSGFVENNLYVNFSDNAGLPQKLDGGSGRKFNAFDLVVHFNYNGDYSTAAKDLISQGYGKFKIVEKFNYSGSGTTQNTCEVNNYLLNADEYIGNILKGGSSKLGINILLGSTGTGKTRFAADSFTKTIVVSRNITTLENYDKYGFERFQMKNVTDNFSGLQDGNKISVTYKSLEKLLKTFDTTGYVFVFDEYHLLTDSYSDVRKETQYAYNILKSLQKTNVVILASANDVLISDKRIKIVSKHVFSKPSVKREVAVTYNSNFNTLKAKVLQRLQEGRKVLLYTNRKDDKPVSEFIAATFADYSILFFDATKHHINLEDLQTDITVCTKALTTGKDILNSNLAMMIYCDDYDTKRSVINQFFGRARDYKTATFDLLFTINFDNEKYKEYDINNMIFGCNEIAKSVISASVNDIAFLHENQKYFVAKDNDKMTINYFAIDNHIETQISLFTLRNTNLLSEFLKLHGYDCTIAVESDTDIEKVEKSGLSDLEKYFNEINLINDGNESDYIFETNAEKRVNGLKQIGFSKKESLYLSLKFDSTFKWGLFVNHLLSEIRLESDNSFVRDYNKILECLNYEFLTALSITEKIKRLGATKTVIGRDIKTIQKLDSEAAKTQRFVLKTLRKYFDIKSKKIAEMKVFAVNKTDFLTENMRVQTSATDIKKLQKISKFT
jgi:hypothetical protein